MNRFMTDAFPGHLPGRAIDPTTPREPHPDETTTLADAAACVRGMFDASSPSFVEP
jgi:hypothetical protein